MQPHEDSSEQSRSQVSRKSTKIIAVALVGIFVLIGGVWLGAGLMMKSAVKDLNASGKQVTADQVVAESFQQNANALAAIAQGDLLLHLPTPKIQDTVIAALTVANAALKYPIKTSETEARCRDLPFRSRP